MDDLEKLTPRNHAEEVALFRLKLIGALADRPLEHGELAAELRTLARKRYRPPGASVLRSYSATTLERWLYQCRRGGMAALKPGTRAQGFALALGSEEREYLLEARRARPGASAQLVVDTLTRKGLLREGQVSVNTVRRLYRSLGLDRLSLRHGAGGRARRRWEAERPGQLWHADVCHGPRLGDGKRTVPLRVHGILDDASRYIVGIRALPTEREADMLKLLVDSVREHGRPEALYVDNGATYRGDTLALICGRLDIRLVHAKPHDPQARGKMERFWRTLREGCLDYTPVAASLHDVQVRLLAFLDRHYHVHAHGSLLGDTPAQRWVTRDARELDDLRLREALTLRQQRRIRKDGTVTVAGVD